MTLKGSSAWITGAGKGIGAAIASALAAEGVHVALTSRTKGDLDKVVSAIRTAGGRASAVPADVSEAEAITDAWQHVQAAIGVPDILVNNAGMGRFAPVADMKVEDFDTMWKLNVRGVFLCTQAVLPSMQKRGSGIIVNISSLAGKNSFVNGAGYAATKWALNGFSNCLRLEVRAQNIKVITVCPGSVNTDFSPSVQDASRASSILQPQDVADAVVTALKLPDRAMMSEIDLRPTNPFRP